MMEKMVQNGGVKQSVILFTRFPYSSALGGEELHTLDIAESFFARGYEIWLLTSDDILERIFKKSRYAQNFKITSALEVKPPVTLLWLIIFTLLYQLFLLYFLYELIRFLYVNVEKHRIVYMLSLPEKLLLTPLALLAGCRVIWLEHARISNSWIYNPWRIIYTLWSFFVDIIVPSKQTAAPMKYVRNIHVIPHGIAAYEASSGGEKRTKFTFTCIARLSKDKGVDVLIRAFEILTRRIRNVSTSHLINGKGKPLFVDVALQIIGSGLMEEEIRVLANQKNLTSQITFYGKQEREKLLSLLRSSHALVLPSVEHDPFGLVCLEAMRSEVPVIVSSVCGITDFLSSDEALVVAPNAESIADAMYRLFSDHVLYEKLKTNGTRAFTTTFDHGRMIDAYDALFRNS